MIVSRCAARQANQDPNVTAEQLTETANRLLYRQFITRGDPGGGSHFDRIVGNLDYFKDLFASFGFRFIYNSVAFWLLDFRGIVMLATTVAIFFSGMAIPIRFFPQALRDLCYALPFSAMIQTPVDVWLGKREGLALLGVLALQLFWAVALLALGKLLLARATHKLVIQGG